MDVHALYRDILWPGSREFVRSWDPLCFNYQLARSHVSIRTCQIAYTAKSNSA